MFNSFFKNPLFYLENSISYELYINFTKLLKAVKASIRKWFDKFGLPALVAY